MVSEEEDRMKMMWLFVKDLRDERKEPRGIHYH